jgi:hypothetical protein
MVKHTSSASASYQGVSRFHKFRAYEGAIQTGQDFWPVLPGLREDFEKRPLPVSFLCSTVMLSSEVPHFRTLETGANGQNRLVQVRFRAKTYTDVETNSTNPFTTAQTISNPLTEGFTETKNQISALKL